MTRREPLHNHAAWVKDLERSLPAMLPAPKLLAASKELKQLRDSKETDYINMTFEEFDQSPNSYCRKLTAAGKFEEAALAGVDYLTKNANRLNPYQKCVMRWHVGQGYATCGKKDLAIEYFNLAGEDKDNMAKLFGPAANAYHKATVAFLNHNRELVGQLFQESMMIQMKDYPHSNVVLIPGRIHDMYENLDKSYQDVFKMDPSLPPHLGENGWYIIKANSMQEEGEKVGERLGWNKSPNVQGEKKETIALSGTAQTATLLGVSPLTLLSVDHMSDKKDDGAKLELDATQSHSVPSTQPKDVDSLNKEKNKASEKDSATTRKHGRHS